jgi:hypothetical protein
MSTIVGDIHTAIMNLAQSTFGVNYTPLKHVFDPSLNDLRGVNKAFGVRHGEASSSEGITRNYTMNQKFQLLIVNQAINRSDDQEVQAVFNNLYDLADSFLNAAFLTRLGLTSTVLIVDQPEMSEPQLMPNDGALLIVGFNVKYRRAIA